jgi:hypothetical protein
MWGVQERGTAYLLAVPEVELSETNRGAVQKRGAEHGAA